MLILVRGLPGSGKTTIAGLLADTTSALVAADDWFTEPDGTYSFDSSKLPEAHAYCQDRAKMHAGRTEIERVIIHNTFSQRWEMEPYIQMATLNGHRLHVVDLYDGGLDNAQLASRNTHGVSEEAIAAMRGRWEHDWKSGDIRPPWER